MPSPLARPALADTRPLAAVLAMDGGNSKTDVALVGADGSVLATARGPGVFPHIVGADATARSLDTLVRQAAASAGLAVPDGGPVAEHTVACLANADLPDEEEELAAAVRAEGWSGSSEVINDTFAVLRSGLADDVLPHWGVGVVCGAGINCVGVGPSGETVRFLALGAIIGDWGGGYGLGMEALWHAMRAWDGRGPATALDAAVTAHFGVDAVPDVAIGIHKGKIDNDNLTSLAPALFRVANDGDEVARAVVARLAAEVAGLAISAMRRLPVPAGPGPHTVATVPSRPYAAGDLTSLAVPVVLGGSVLTARDPLLMPDIIARLLAVAPAADIRVIDVPPIAGAAMLGLDHVGAGRAASARLRASFPRLG
jgi:N-acetylglucosamine kinase-like BadF-type ATPase